MPDVWYAFSFRIVCVCFGLAIDRWRQAAGVEVQFKLSVKLVGERTRRPSSFVLSNHLIADDTALVNIIFC